MAAFLLVVLLLWCWSASACRTSCGVLPIRYPFSLDDGCGSPLFRRLLLCPNPSSSMLFLRTPSGSYQVISLSYSEQDTHLVVSDPASWSCSHRSQSSSSSGIPFALDASTRLSLSPRTSFLFLNCSPEAVLARPRPPICERFPDRCGLSCDSAAYLCRSPPGCPNALADRSTACCSYFPSATESIPMMLRHCAGYAAVIWTESPVGDVPATAQYAIRVDYQLPVTAQCRRCLESQGICGFDPNDVRFLCICPQGNSTTTCQEGFSRHRSSANVIVVSAIAASLSGLVGLGALLLLYLKKMRSKNVVTCGVQTNQNRLF